MSVDAILTAPAWLAGMNTSTPGLASAMRMKGLMRNIGSKVPFPDSAAHPFARKGPQSGSLRLVKRNHVKTGKTLFWRQGECSI